MTAVSQLLGDEELQLRSSAAEMLRKESPVGEFRRLRDEGKTPSCDKALWSQFVAMGWTAMLVDEEHGGLAYGHRGAGLIVEEMGRNLVLSPFVSTSIHAVSVLAAASDELRAEVLPAIAEGTTTVALALNEGRAFDPQATTLTATSSPDGWVLNGEKAFVTDGVSAEQFIVLARTDAGLSLFHVSPGSSAQVRRNALDLVDHRDCAHLTFDHLVLPETALIGGEGQGDVLIEKLIDVAAAHSASELLGISDALFDITIDYLKVREQFGELIGAFQALQHRAAKMFTRIELLRSLVMDAHAALDSKRDDASMACSHARVMAIETANLVGQEAIQLHGGMGVTDELDVGLYYKRVLTLRQFDGNRGYHRERFARLSGY